MKYLPTLLKHKNNSIKIYLLFIFITNIKATNPISDVGPIDDAYAYEFPKISKIKVSFASTGKEISTEKFFTKEICMILTELKETLERKQIVYRDNCIEEHEKHMRNSCVIPVSYYIGMIKNHPNEEKYRRNSAFMKLIKRDEESLKKAKAEYLRTLSPCVSQESENNLSSSSTSPVSSISPSTSPSSSEIIDLNQCSIAFPSMLISKSESFVRNVDKKNEAKAAKTTEHTLRKIDTSFDFDSLNF